MSAYEVGDFVSVYDDDLEDDYAMPGALIDVGEITKVHGDDMYDVQGEHGFYAFVDESQLWRRKP